MEKISNYIYQAIKNYAIATNIKIPKHVRLYAVNIVIQETIRTTVVMQHAIQKNVIMMVENVQKYLYMYMAKL